MASDDGDADEAQRTERVRQQGAPEGLFRGCMDVIRRSHSVGQALRTGGMRKTPLGLANNSFAPHR